MEIKMRPLNEVTEQAIVLLSREMGIADTVRFISQFSSGYSNYTEERDTLFGDMSLDEILRQVKDSRAKKT